MTVVSADLGLLPDSALLRPSVWIGNTVTAEVVFRDAARLPIVPPGPVTFLWKSPGNVLLELSGVLVTGKPGVYRCSYQAPSTGSWSFRAQGGGDGPVLSWSEFVVEAEPPEGSIPQQAIWLISPDVALVSLRGVHLAGATIPDLPVKSLFEAGDSIPAISAAGESWRVTGQAILDAAVGAVDDQVNLAEAAADAADDARQAAQAASSAAGGSAGAASGSAVAAQTARSGAETARDAAAASATTAGTKAGDAETARAAAVVAKSAAETARDAAAASATTAGTKAGDAETARAAAVVAKGAAETARDAAAASATTAGTKAGDAETARAAAVVAKGAAETARDAAANSSAAAAAIATALPASVPVMAGYLYSFRLGRYYQEWGASRATVAQALSTVLTVSRASVGAYFDASGTLIQAANNQPRIAYDFATLTPRGIALSEARTNQIRNPWFVGAVVGSPGTNPNFMTLTGTTVGVSRAIAGFGVLANGLPYLDLSITGTATASGTTFLGLEGNSIIAAANGEAWTLSPYLSVPSGNPANLSVQLNIAMGDSGGATLGGFGLASSVLVLSSTLSRFEHRVVLNQAGTAFARTSLRLSLVNGVTYAETLRIVIGNIEKAAAASAPMFPTSGTTGASTRLADATLVPDLNQIGWNNAAMTLAAKFRVPALPLAGTIAGLWRADDGTESERFRAYINPDGTVTVGVTIGGVVTTVTPAGTVTPDTEVRVAAGFASGVLVASLNGGAVASAAPTGNPYATNRLRLGSADIGGATSMLNGGLLEFAARQGALTGATLQGLLA